MKKVEELRLAALYPWPGLPTVDRGAASRVIPLVEFLASHVREVELLSPGSRDTERGNVHYRGHAPTNWERKLLGGAFWLFDGMTHHVSGGKISIRERRQLWHYKQAELQSSLRRAVRETVERADIVLLEYAFWSRLVPASKPVILTMHDILSDLVSEPALREKVWRREIEACRRASAVFCVAKEDQARLKSAGVDAEFVPHGFSASSPSPDFQLPGELRQIAAHRESGGMICIFVGSSLQPNREAVTAIQAMAEELSDTRIFFVIAGACCGKAQLMGNLASLGVIPEDELRALYEIADVALAPIVSGSGSSTKVLEALARRKVLVTTPTGARGWEIAGEAVVCGSPEDFPDVLRRLAGDAGERRRLGEAGKKFAEAFRPEKVYQPYLARVKELAQR